METNYITVTMPIQTYNKIMAPKEISKDKIKDIEENYKDCIIHDLKMFVSDGSFPKEQFEFLISRVL